ncbi:restriction endonuclease subunit S [Streptomyces cucumeris]|uniref:restriction endonuclease subunit S n=1 Tax=Streptomyces cucumeris TaxID=2962890 RepID=UPI003D74E449
MQVTSLGWAPAIPSGWKVVPLNFVAKMGTGHTPDRNRKEYWESCTIPWVTTPDVTRRADSLAPLMETEQQISELGMANSAAVLHPTDTVMLSRTASVGYSVRIGRPMATTQAFVTWHAGPDLDPRYLLLALRAMKQEWRRLAYGSTHLTIYMPDLESIRIPLPPLEEQRRIADFLHAETARIDKMRLCSRRQVELLGDRFKEIMRRETTVSQGPAVETGVPWMPKMHHRWKLHKVSQEFRTASGTTPTSSDASYFDGPYPWVNSADVRDELIRKAEKSVTKKALLDFSALKVNPAGALVVALYGQGTTKGRVGILDMDACLNQACCALVPTGSISTEFAYYWFRAHKDGIVAQAVGAGQPNLSQELIRQLRIPAPDTTVQLQITSRLRDFEKSARAQVSQLERRDALLAERRHSLIAAAVTGQFDVSTASGRNVTDGVTA